ncbi:MAG TPA: aldose epimerase family protein [Gemmatimonadales bacterium]|nr:aldose epimerase family protein [Gemmatimonadales bacterium]
MDVTRRRFGTTPAGDLVELFTLTDPNGLVVKAMNYGATVVSLLAPDRHGARADVVLGHASLEAYLQDSRYLGAIVGRLANRTSEARFRIDGITYHLTANAGRHHLHGGLRGFDKVLWEAIPFSSAGAAGVTLRHTSPDGTEGYPGRLEVEVTYRVTERHELIVDYRATTDKPTPVNLTHHGYFNLAGQGDVLGHSLRIDADAYIPVDEALIPTGTIAPVADTSFDFRTPAPIGARGRVYDHSFLVRRNGPGLVHAARVADPVSGRTLDVSTTEPTLHCYSGVVQGLALETQRLPDAMNQAAFPDPILRPGAEYRSRTVFLFGVE